MILFLYTRILLLSYFISWKNDNNLSITSSSNFLMEEKEPSNNDKIVYLCFIP